MCEQKRVFKKIKAKGRVNGYDVELAEAQMHDYMTLKRDVDTVREDVSVIKTEQAVQSTKLDLIIQRLNSPVEQERKAGAAFLELKNIFSSWRGWAIIIFFLMSIALAGDKILQLTGWLPTGV